MRTLKVILFTTVFFLMGGFSFLLSAFVGYYYKSQPKSLILSYLIAALLFLLSFATLGTGVFGVIHLNMHNSISLGGNNALPINTIWGAIWVLVGNSYGMAASNAEAQKSDTET